MLLSVVIVSWQVKEKLRVNLQSLLGSVTDFEWEVFVVDNGSEDGSAAMVRQEFPTVHLIANSDNKGFAQANNQAIKKAKGDFILLLNPDMSVTADTLKNIVHWAQNNPQATVTGCKLLDAKGQTVQQVRRFPGFWDQLAVTFKLPHFWPAIVNGYLCSDFNYEQASKVDSVRGSFFLINRENFRRLNGEQDAFLDERYFIWFEEVDFCRQVDKLGGEVWYTPTASCYDYVGQSFAQVKRSQTQKYFSESMLKYFQKWESKGKYIILKIAWKLVKIFV